MKNVIMK